MARTQVVKVEKSSNVAPLPTTNARALKGLRAG
jgi:hypothetical protein